MSAVVLRVFLPFAVAYLLSFLLRVVNAVAGEPISAEVGLSAAQLGFLTSVYFFGFALTQLPFGVLMDRWGPRRVEAATLLLAVAGCGVFMVATSFAELTAGRVLMGIGTSMCLMGPFTAYRRWFSPAQLPVVVSLHMTFGAVGSMLGGGPTDALLSAIGWRPMFALLGALVLLTAGAILVVVPARQEDGVATPFGTLVRETGTIMASRALWRIAPLSAVTQAGYLAVVSLWTGPWLREVAGYDSAAAATWLSITSGGLVAGLLGFGLLSSRIAGGARAWDIVMVGAVLYTAVSALLILLPADAATPLWTAATFFGSSAILTYAVAAAAFPPAMAGRVNTALNFIVFLFAFVAQWAFGGVLELFPDGAGGHTRTGYDVALGALLVLQVAAFVPLLLPRR